MATSILYGNSSPFPNLLKIAVTVGATSASAVILGGTISGIGLLNHAKDWRDYALWGAVGSIIGASWGVTGRPWFGDRY